MHQSIILARTSHSQVADKAVPEILAVAWVLKENYSKAKNHPDLKVGGG